MAQPTPVLTHTLVPVKQVQVYDAIVRGLRTAAGQAVIAALMSSFGNALIPVPAPYNYLFAAVVGGGTVNALAKFMRDKFAWNWLPV